MNVPQNSELIIRHPITVRVAGSLWEAGSTPIQTDWYYDQYDPYAVSVDFGVDFSEPNVWRFGRELAATGLVGRAGMGDVQFKPASTNKDVHLHLSSPDGESTLWVPTTGLARFMAATYRRVPKGEESTMQKPSIEHVIRLATRVEDWRRIRGYALWPDDWLVLDAHMPRLDDGN
jgi:hypothetical protein